MKSERAWFWGIFVIAIVPLLGFWRYGLFDLDEGFYAAVASEMNRRGEWITPYYNGEPWYEKPILLYWFAKPAIAWFGEAVGPRLPSVLATAGTILLLGWFARRRFVGPWTAPVTMLVYGGSLLPVAAGRMMLTDSLLVLAFTGAMLCFWESLVGEARWRLATAALLGVAVLAKGPVALVLFAAVAMTTYASARDLRPRFRGYWLAGSVLTLLVAATWYVPAYLAGGETFVQRFLIEQNVGRFTGGDAAHSVGGMLGLLFYPVVLTIGMTPWIFALPGALRSKTAEPSEAPLRRFLLWWALAVTVLFTISSAKLPHYALPAVPPIALLIGSALARRWPGRHLVASGCAWVVAIGVFAQVAFEWWYIESGQQEAHALVRSVRDQRAPMAAYQLPRRPGRSSTGRLDETGLPSLSFYTNATVARVETLDELKSLPRKAWIFTRTGRLSDADLASIRTAGRTIEPARTPSGQTRYRLYRLD